MFFTQEDFKKIEQYLISNSVRDTEFSEASYPLSGNEIIAIIQDGNNTKITISELIKQLSLLGASDFINVTDRYKGENITLSQAIDLIPNYVRKLGQVITFLNTEGNWELYQFNGEVSQWEDTSLWKDLLVEISGNSNIIPDEEDITGVKSGDNTIIKFNDKQYNVDNFSGLGRVYLRKNISEDSNILTQELINSENTIYIIQYDYDLNGGEITIPSNCVLDFQGGSISNGTIIGNGTIIKASPIKIFETNVSVSGTWNIPYSYAEWFGADNKGLVDSSEAINKAIKIVDKLKLLKGTYLVNSPVIVSRRNKLEGSLENTVIKAGDAIANVISAVGHDDIDSLSYGYIRNLKIDGDNKAVRGIECIGVTNGFFIENIYITSCTEAGMFISRGWYAVYRNIWIWYCKYGMYITNQDVNGDGNKGDINGIQFTNLWLNHNTDYALYIKGIPGYGNQFNSCTFENSGGDTQVNIENLGGSINFLNCYCEGANANCIKVTSQFSSSGAINIFGGVYTNTLKEQFNIGTIGRFNVIGAHIVQFTSPSEHNIITDAGRNYLNFNNQGGEFSTGDSVVASGDVLGEFGKNYNSNEFLCNANTFSANRIRALGYKGGTTALDDTYFEIGSSKREAVTESYMYRMLLGFSYNSGITVNALVKRASEAEDQIINIGSIGRYQISYPKFVATESIYFPVVTSLGDSSGYGASKFYANTHCLCISNGQKWYTADGTATDAKFSGTTSERPAAGDVRPGYIYKDTTLGKFVIWNGSGWEPLDNTSA